MNAINRFEGEHRFLSNFASSPVRIRTGPGGDIITCPTVEHAFQACKTLDMRRRVQIATTPLPGTAKAMGRKSVLRPGWNEMRIDVMRLLLAQKFAVGSELAQRLLDTGDAQLVEGNHWGDQFWGVSPMPGGAGLNHLGRLLMERREQLRTGGEQ